MSTPASSPSSPTETFAAFLLCLFSYIFLYVAQTQLRSAENQTEPVVHFNKIVGAAIVLGIVAALLSLARTTPLPVAAVAVVMLFFRLNGKMRIGAISSFIVGFALVIVPWFAAQQLIVGRASLVVDRVSRLNYGLGTQAVTQGWTGFPIQFKPIMDRTISSQTLAHLSKDPGPYLWLLQDKLPRMLKCGWNDFKTWLGLFSPAAQDVLHQFIIAFAIAGIILGLDGVKEKRINGVVVPAA